MAEHEIEEEDPAAVDPEIEADIERHVLSGLLLDGLDMVRKFALSKKPVNGQPLIQPRPGETQQLPGLEDGATIFKLRVQGMDAENVYYRAIQELALHPFSGGGFVLDGWPAKVTESVDGFAAWKSSMDGGARTLNEMGSESLFDGAGNGVTFVVSDLARLDTTDKSAADLAGIRPTSAAIERKSFVRLREDRRGPKGNRVEGSEGSPYVKEIRFHQRDGRLIGLDDDDDGTVTYRSWKKDDDGKFTEEASGVVTPLGSSKSVGRIMIRAAVTGEYIGGASLRGKCFFLNAAGLMMTALSASSFVNQSLAEMLLGLLYTENPVAGLGGGGAPGNPAPTSTNLSGDSVIGSRRFSGDGKLYFVERSPAVSAEGRAARDEAVNAVQSSMRSASEAQRASVALTATEWSGRARTASSTTAYLAEVVAMMYAGVFEDMLQLSGDVPVGKVHGGTVKLPVYQTSAETLAIVKDLVIAGLAPPRAISMLLGKARELDPDDQAALEIMMKEHTAETSAREFNDAAGEPLAEGDEEDGEN